MTKEESIGDYLTYARSLVGNAKWRHRGRKPWAVDCLGLIVLSLNQAGVETRDRNDYGRDPWNAGLQAALKDHFGDPVVDWQKGDIALIQWDGMKAPSHVAFIGDYIHGGLSLIHSFSQADVIEHRIDDLWKSRIVEVYRVWHS